MLAVSSGYRPRMVSKIILVLYFQTSLSFSEWIEISKTPIEPDNTPTTKIKTSIPHFTTRTTQFKKNTERDSPQERTFINRVFVDEQILEERLSGRRNDGNKKNESYMGFMPFIENIQSTLIKNAHQTIKSKIDLLQELKYSLLFNIKDKISNLWRRTSTREAREYYDKEDSHMDFPSNEGALMTIGFLTFAVFLIKLVLKLIYALKNKNAASTSTTPVIVGRKKRETFDEEAMKILQLIEEFKLD